MDAQRFLELLDERHHALEAEVSAGAQGARPVDLDQSSVGRLSRMDALQGQAMSVEAQRRRKLALVRLAAARKRFEGGDWGMCLDCGEAIAEGRLEHDPAVTLCIECARRD